MRVNNKFSLANKKRILVIGSGGAGKTVFALRLGETLKLPVIHLDRHFWKPGWVSMERPTWRRKLRAFVKGKRWIIDGNYGHTFDIRFPRAQLIIYFDFSRWLCLWRVLKRRIAYHGKSRPDIHSGCPEKLDWDFLLWIWNFRRDVHPLIMEGVKQHKAEKKLIILPSPREAEAFLKAQSV